jgi:ribose transport system substrate-binding protein
MKRVLAILGVSALAIVACNRETGGGGAKPRVAFVTNCVAPFWTIAEAGVEAAKQKFGVDVSFYMPPSGNVAEQKAKLEDLMASGVDGIAVSPIDPANQTSDLDGLAARTNLITHDSDAPDSKRLVYVGMDNYAAGRMCGQLVKRALPNGGKVAMFVANISQDNARRRRQGVIDELLDRSADSSRYDDPGQVLKNDKFTILDTYTDGTDHAKGKANAEDALNGNPDLACMVGLFEYNTPLCLEVLKQSGKFGAVKVVAFDEASQTLQGIQDGHVTGTVVQDPYNYGFKSVEVLAALAKGDKSVIPANKFIDIPGRIIDAANVAEFWADLKAKTGRK